MIGRIAGTLLEKSPSFVLIDCHGVGYEIWIPMSTFHQLPAAGEVTILLTHLLVREDAHLLYGFATVEERATFVKMLKVSGLGARTALAILSGLSVHELTQAVLLQDASRLTRIPGIGKKTAERLLLELKGKLKETQPHSMANAAANHTQDIFEALQALGYSEKEALQTTRGLPEGISVSEGIKQALKTLLKA